MTIPILGTTLGRCLAALILVLLTLTGVQAQSPLTLISPSSPQALSGCQDLDLLWTKGPTASGVQIVDISFNGGRSWRQADTVRTNGADTGRYTMSVPAKVTTAFRIRIRDSGTTVGGATTAFNSTITLPGLSPVDLIRPVGLETYRRFSTQRIEWEGLSSIYEVSFSANGGTSWAVIGTTSNNYLDWNIPFNGPRFLVRVRDSAARCLVDFSDTVFSVVVAPVIGLTSFNGGENVRGGSNVIISWRQDLLTADSVRIELSLDGGLSYQTLAAAHPKEEFFGWMVPDIITDQARIRVSEIGNPSVFDASNGDFSITTADIGITADFVSQTATGCDSIALSWVATSVSGTFTILYSADAVNYFSVADNVSGPAGLNTKMLAVPNIPTTQGRFIIYDKFNQSVRDTTSGLLTVVPVTLPDITITSPNGGELLGLSLQPITYVAASSVLALDFYFSPDAGQNWVLRESGIPNTGTYLWNAPDRTSDNYLIRLEETGRSCNVDLSDSLFVITDQPFIVLVSPRGGEVLRSNSPATIRWRAANLPTTNRVAIDYSLDGGATFTLGADSVANTGTFTWVLPNVTSTMARIRVRALGIDSITVAAVSPADFSIISNLRPIVSGGPDQVVTLPTREVTLVGSARDPDGEIVTLQWTQLAGPSTAALFGTMTSTLRATTLQEGVYQFRLRATDNFGASSDGIVIVTVVSDNANQRWQWAQRLGASDRDRGSKVTYDGAGHVYVTGYFGNVIGLQGQSVTSMGNTDMFLAKFDTSGNMIWIRGAGGMGEDEGNDVVVAQTPSGRQVYVCGYFNGMANFGGQMLQSAGRRDAFLAALDENGNWLWTQRYGGTGDDEAWALDLGRASRDIFMTGSFSNSAAFGAAGVLTSAGRLDIFISRHTRTDGNVVFARRYGGPGNDIGFALKSNQGQGFSGVAVTGSFSETMQMGPIILTSAGGTDIFIAGLLENGTLVGARREGGTGNDVGRGIGVSDPTWPVPSVTYVSGHFSNTMSVAPGLTFTSQGNTDVFVLAYNDQGNPIAGTSFGSPREDQVRDMALSPSSVRIGGHIDRPAMIQGAAVISFGEKDAFVASFSPALSFQSVATGGGNSDDYTRGLTILPSGATIATGQFINRSMFGIFPLGRSGAGDIWVAKLAAPTTTTGGGGGMGSTPGQPGDPGVVMSPVLTPNPAGLGSTVGIRFPGLTGEETVTIALQDVTGRTLTQQVVIMTPGQEARLSTQGLSAGVYRVQAHTTYSRWSTSLIVR